jgi:hypothetical protein
VAGRFTPMRRSERSSSRRLTALTVLTLALGIVALVKTPIEWIDYAKSETIQNGPAVNASLIATNVTEQITKTGTDHTTHFYVSFRTRTGDRIDTTVTAGGEYPQLVHHRRIRIRYDPGDPTAAELVGHPNHTLFNALLATVFTIVVLTIGLWAAKVFWGIGRLTL